SFNVQPTVLRAARCADRAGPWPGRIRADRRGPSDTRELFPRHSGIAEGLGEPGAGDAGAANRRYRVTGTAARRADRSRLRRRTGPPDRPQHGGPRRAHAVVRPPMAPPGLEPDDDRDAAPRILPGGLRQTPRGPG